MSISVTEEAAADEHARAATTVARTVTVAPSLGEVAAAAACVEAFDAEYDYVCRMLRRFSIRDADIEDVAQEVFLVVWRHWGEYDRARPLRPWLAGIAYRVAYNYRGRSWQREVPESSLEELQDPDADPERGRAEADLRSVLLRALQRLSQKVRPVIVLHELEEIRMREVASLLGIPLHTAYSRLRKGRRQLLVVLRRLQARSWRGDQLDLPGQLEQLLARERQNLPLPLERRRKAITRLRALVPLLPGLARTADAPRPRWPRLFVAAAWTTTLASITGTLLFGSLRAARHAGTSPVAAASRVPPAAHKRALTASPPAFRLAPDPEPVAATPGNATAPEAGPGTEVPGGADAVLTSEGLVGHWGLDDGSGSGYARDLSGGGNDCALHGLDGSASWTEGRNGTAIRFGGRGWLECPQTAALDRASEEITIALWVKRAVPVNRVRALVTRQLGHGTLDAFHLAFRDDFLVLRSTLWPVSLATAFPAVGDDGHDRWHHIAATRGRDRRARLYIDGQLVASKKTGRVAAAPECGPLIIGGGSNSPTPHQIGERFDGFIDDVLVFARALGAAEIAALAGNSQPVNFGER